MYQERTDQLSVHLYFLAIAVGVAAINERVFELFVADSAIASTAAQFPITNFIYSNFPLVILVIGIIGLIAIHGKRGQPSL